ncbi:MAG TPA: preprotein translocase subunit SecG [Candidatus Xenobia bacterium]|nr:preprotein translocase subunit SecG [Candidatus Xenobia bacterium]
MNEKLYWALAGLVAAGIVYGGIMWFRPLLIGLHVLACGILILVVLLQSGRAADLAGAFGGAGSQTAFGPRGAATFLSKATSFLAIVFMVTSLALALASSRGMSAAEEAAPPAQTTETPAPAPPQQQPPQPQETPPQNPPPQNPPPPPQP